MMIHRGTCVETVLNHAFFHLDLNMGFRLGFMCKVSNFDFFLTFISYHCCSKFITFTLDLYAKVTLKF